MAINNQWIYSKGYKAVPKGYAMENPVGVGELIITDNPVGNPVYDLYLSHNGANRMKYLFSFSTLEKYEREMQRLPHWTNTLKRELSKNTSRL